ncbi:hypothetical protein [Aeromonas enteropelogenes]|uniref:hypothetical protein n=1 Tax=Aeromonas enteropelogenes TaxID=29489 RepID=UPI003BA0ABCD
MSPAIISEPHEKKPLKLSEWDEYDFIDHEEGILSHVIIRDFGPNSSIMKFTLAMNKDKTEGVLVVELMDAESIVISCVGNVKFRILLDDNFGELKGGAQIESVYIDANYRGMGIAIAAYEQILAQFNIISDTHQTIDGAVFWKFKLVTQAHIDVRVFQDFPHSPVAMTDEGGEDEIYTIDKSHLEPLIWGAEGDVDPDVDSITYGYNIGQDKVVLVAKRRI